MSTLMGELKHVNLTTDASFVAELNESIAISAINPNDRSYSNNTFL